MKINNIQTYTNISEVQRQNKKYINKDTRSIEQSTTPEKSKGTSFSGLFSLVKRPFDAKIVQYDIPMLPEQEYAINEDTIFESCDYEMDLSCKELRDRIRELKRGESFIIGREGVSLPDMPMQISRKHLKIKKNLNGSLVAQDLNSMNGTNIKQNVKEIPLYEYHQTLEPGKYHLLPYTAIVSADRIPVHLQDYREKLETLPEGRELIVGRNGDSDIWIDNDYVSWEHLALRPYKGQVLVKDLHSTNGSKYLYCEEEKKPESTSRYTSDFYNIRNTSTLQKGVPTRIPNDCQIYLGQHFTIDIRNPNIIEILNKNGKIKIGRNSSCDIVADDFYSQVSREHLQLEKNGDDIIATDLNSTMATQIIPKNKIRAFNGGVANIELGQHNIGDCYLLSSIYALSMTKKGQNVLENMVHVDDNGNYIVNFYDNDFPISVSPEELDGQKFMDTEKINVSGDLGIRAIERAYGKLVKRFGGGNRTLYMQIDDGGMPDIALKKMTGIDSKREKVTNEQIKRTLNDLCSNGLENYVLTCSTPNNDNFSGYVDYQRRFNKNHAYGIKDINKYNQTIEIANPHNTRKTEIISWDEFAQYFDYIFIGNF